MQREKNDNSRKRFYSTLDFYRELLAEEDPKHSYSNMQSVLEYMLRDAMHFTGRSFNEDYNIANLRAEVMYTEDNDKEHDELLGHPDTVK